MSAVFSVFFGWLVLCFMCFIGGAFYEASFDIATWAARTREMVIFTGGMSFMLASLIPLGKGM